MRRVLALLVVSILLAAATTGTALAITNGHPDGDDHPYVGNLVADFITPGYIESVCSGSLVAPQIFVTSAHCANPGIDPANVWVSFDPVYRIGFSTLYHGHMVTAVDPANYVGQAGFSGKYGNSNGFDIAVVHLDDAPPITPAQLPAAGLLDSLNLEGQTFTAVGYGIVRANKTRGPNDFIDNLDPGFRYASVGEFRSLQANFLTLSQNPATGDGGICYGDSGGPHLLGDSDVIVALTTLGDGACRATGRAYRLDIPFARQFLAEQGVPLP